MNDNARTHETANGKGQSRHVPDGPNEPEAYLYVTVIGQQSARSLQHLQMVAALYGWDLLVMAEPGLSAATWGTITQLSTSDQEKTSEGR